MLDETSETRAASPSRGGAQPQESLTASNGQQAKSVRWRGEEVRDAYLEETTMLSARNEELAQLHAQYLRRLETTSDGSHGSQREPSLDQARPLGLSSSVTSSTTAFSEESTESRFVKVMKPDAIQLRASPFPGQTRHASLCRGYLGTP